MYESPKNKITSAQKRKTVTTFWKLAPTRLEIFTFAVELRL